MLDALFQQLRTFAGSSIVEVGPDGATTSVTFAELADRVTNLAARLTAEGLEAGDRICLQAKNSLDYVTWDLAAIKLGLCLLTPTDEQSWAEVSRAADEHGIRLIVSDAAGAEGAVASQIAKLPSRLPVRSSSARQPVPDLHSMVFSSGTSGILKGINISRRGSERVVRQFLEAYGVTAADRHLLFLPFSNYQQRMSLYGCISAGCGVVLCPYQRVFQTVRTHHPTFLIAPPVFYSTALQLTGGEPARLSDMLGGHLRFAITGMAPIKVDVLKAYWSAHIPLYEAYGLTETGMVAWNVQGATKLGSVGRPIVRDEIRLRPDGEVYVTRQSPLSLGYFGEAAANASEVFTSQGIATGDLAELDVEGFLHLKGRKKDMILLSSGKKFHPREPEALLVDGGVLREVIVVAADSGSQVTAIVPRGPNNIAAPDERRVEQAVLTAMAPLESYKRVSRVIFTDLELNNEARFRTRNMKLDRAAIARFFLQPASTEGARASAT